MSALLAQVELALLHQLKAGDEMSAYGRASHERFGDAGWKQIVQRAPVWNGAEHALDPLDGIIDRIQG